MIAAFQGFLGAKNTREAPTAVGTNLAGALVCKQLPDENLLGRSGVLFTSTSTPRKGVPPDPETMEKRGGKTTNAGMP